MSNEKVFTVEQAHALSIAVLDMYHADIITSEQLGDYIDKIEAKTKDDEEE